jgi:hypothetical protein
MTCTKMKDLFPSKDLFEQSHKNLMDELYPDDED